MTEQSLSPTGADAPRRRSLKEAVALYTQRDVLSVSLLGFSSGLPLALTGGTLSLWMKDVGVTLTAIGLFSLVGLPYTLKFLWAPVLDAVDVPILSRLLGRRRGWLLACQIVLIAAIAALALQDPISAPFGVAACALAVAIASATQDIAVDAFRVERLESASEQAAGMAGYVTGYRVAMLATGAGVIALVAYLETALGLPRGTSWFWGYMIAAGCVAIGVIATLFAREPRAPVRAPDEGTGHRLVATTVGAFGEFLRRNQAVMILLFVMLFKFCDAFAGVLTGPFVLDIGFSKATYVEIVKVVGFGGTIAGSFVGAWIARARPLVTCLWISGVLQITSNLGFTLQAYVGPNEAVLTGVILIENFTSAIGTVIFVAYLSALCGAREHTATQYALLTALTAVGRTLLGSSSGAIAEASGWPLFFILTAVAGLPGLAALGWLQMKGHFAELARDKA
ncbi:PAT family beta-lactamase induction signal transducer AmpG [Xanthobacter sp. SG618]|uniref:AmpG family muropeptide MFS transporter n=1 Tax=Xanthobacter sp. SG618 TaxID=2587121 RepID=UPI00145D8DC6|nr:MFS transporter [Xanthobacter sp. SG618]NMN57064.1 PAT family beta-lactamase induction signal transducer AmpG [Xanthobacter sp. SG618]